MTSVVISDTDLLKDDLIKKINILRERKYPFEMLNKSLEGKGLSSSNGYDSVLSKIKNLSVGDVDKTLIDIKLEVNSLLMKHCLYANKAISIYKLKDDVDFNSLEKSLGDLAPENQILDKYYALKTSPKKNFIATLSISDDLRMFIYHDHRSYIFRSKEESSSVVDSFNDALNPLDENQEVIELIKVVKVTMPTFDFVAIDRKLKLLIIGFDLAYTFPKAMINKVIDQLENKVKKITGLHYLSKLNLRNSIENMEKEVDGTVFGHAFSSSGGTFNHLGKTSSKRADVRKDSFFTKGSHGEILDYYGIRKRYFTGKRDCAVTVALSFREYKKSPLSPIYVAILDYMQEEHDFRHCVKKLIDNS